MLRFCSWRGELDLEVTRRQSLAIAKVGFAEIPRVIVREAEGPGESPPGDVGRGEKRVVPDLDPAAAERAKDESETKDKDLMRWADDGGRVPDRRDET